MLWKTLATAATLALGAVPAASETFDLKVATFVTGQHGMSKWIDQWAASLTEQSEGRLQFEILHGAQMGPPPAYYDLARNGQADIVWHLHGATPGRFELTEISNMPFLFCSAEQATLVLNDPRLRSEYLDAEHRGVKVLALFMHPPGQINSNDGPILSLDDMAGKGLRPASSAVAKFIAAMGGTPVGLPPTEMAEALQKGTIQGAMIDYGGAGLAFGLGPHLTDVTEVYSYTSSFMLGMNPNSFESLPEDLQMMIDESLTDVSAEIGQVWDGLDAIGKKVLMDVGVTIHTLDGEARAEMVEVGNSVTEGYVAELEDAGKPGTAVLAMMREIAAEVGPVGAGCQG
ncbi:TRAP transporter substrate-binding protein [Pseudaestuariivita sp.]|uniref:TRAP transporter substrate-binding protein n=1 Tax=Pseudaestuariivita sp. TaxID=2211669 RepID=UPI0040585334